MKRLRNYSTVLTVLCCIALLGCAALMSALEKQSYREQGREAKRDGKPVTDWPYSDWNGAEFEWVVGWYEAQK